MSTIGLLTDFGTDGVYAACMKGVILSIDPEAVLVDVSHAITPQNVRHGAFVLQQTALWFPRGTIFVCVVDPGVGGERKLLCAKMGPNYYLAPDNGLLSLVAQQNVPEIVVDISFSEYRGQCGCDTFHGRDVLAPVAAHLSLGVPIEDLGPSVDEMFHLDWKKPRIHDGRVHGHVMAVDSFGNIITDIREKDLRDASLTEVNALELEGTVISQHVRAYCNAPAGTLVWLIGSSGLVEVAKVNGSAAKRLNVEVGEGVVMG